ncbi:Probable siderophore transport system ATP-binding protein YusV [Leclercia adecarboxylata]|uniref:Probable siderophore transport system ATP-binding protein YusV n=1 Tax=Leclercia adecarboxylata TaxID=83655 RepID=A0A4U9HI23_9ENTR|nr:Probable siderophore transport system ATP-binding protein YusV [Leclercia adecarboxylata]
MLIGALVLSLASVFSKNIVPGVIIPVGIVTSLVGVPFFLSIIIRNRGERMTEGLRVCDLHTGYRKKKDYQWAEHPASPSRQITALLGPNGSGKSTLLRALADLNPAQGALLLNGEDLMTLPSATRAQKVVYLPQSPAAGRASAHAGIDYRRPPGEWRHFGSGCRTRKPGPFWTNWVFPIWR